ncbi:type II toxin-antitoxin system PemK/MazF family toxin [Sphingomonas bacterium]|uniref:type II toxin-antitoxin system PemK/MazF family toxin n=1 Tax=Sphingomonas bacterium TaxID=1895847 RepID=UPI001575D824|nr:type II toxin-antitoxin system PemK/MazF family toxin [Sphingomonas bacterium]
MDQSLTGNVKWANAPGNVLLPPIETGLDLASVANVSQLTAIDRRQLRDHMGRIPRNRLTKVFAGIDTVLGR